MKKPLIEKCPCCEARFGDCEDAGMPEAECVQVQETTLYGTKYSEPALHWKCLVCGCRWKHGQFGEKPDREFTFNGERVEIEDVTRDGGMTEILLSNGHSIATNTMSISATDDDVIKAMADRCDQFEEREV